MTFQAYLDNIKAKTGKTPEDFRKEAAKKGLTEYQRDYGMAQIRF